jgi:hypothetical protein
LVYQLRYGKKIGVLREIFHMDSKATSNAILALLVIGGATWWWWSDKKAVERAREAPANGHIYVTSMKDLQAAYEANEVAAQQNIGDSVVQVTGIVKSINAALGGASARIETDSGGTVRLAKEEQALAAGLHKGDKVTFRCARMNFILGSPYGTIV